MAYVEPWEEQALCSQIDPDSFFPEKGDLATQAKKVCRDRCLVRLKCLVTAVEHNERNCVWGGVSERQRRRLAKLSRDDLLLAIDDLFAHEKR